MKKNLTKKEMIAYILESKMMIKAGTHEPLENLNYMNKYSKAEVARLYEMAVAYSNR